MKDIEKKLWESANSLRKNIDAAEYKHVVLGLVFLKYISDKFEYTRDELLKGETVAGSVSPDELEDRDLYIMNNAFYVPEVARWGYLKDNAKSPEIGLIIDAAMDAIEADNKKQLKGVLPKVYAKENLDKASLGGLVDIISTIELVDQTQSSDILGHVFEYFLGQFALAEGQKGGQFYTPKSVVTLLVDMLEPYKGRVMDPCCGSGGMFVQSEKFVEGHQGRIDDISIYGQESNQTTWKLCKMNLAIRGIDASEVRWNTEGSFLKNEHKDVKVDFILANPPFNDDDWSGEQLADDGRWIYGTPPPGNANYAWLQHFLYHLAPNGRAGVVLSKGSLTTATSGEDVIRKNMIEAGIVECIVNLPGKIFVNTQIPACLWFLRKDNKRSTRPNEILFIDAREVGYLVSRKHREFSDEEIKSITDVYHNWRTGEGEYEDVAGFCKSVSIEEVKKLDCVLTPGRYVGLAEEENDFNFKERFLALKAEFESQLQEELELNKRISENLLKIQIDE